jgi:hypothetical protein
MDKIDKDQEFTDRIYEIEKLKIEFKLKSTEILMLQLLAINENNNITYESYKQKLIRDRTIEK